ncbi:hypothetical protein D4764_09G0005280 [Takifugu flavidus]|uniref:DH domain-containing protein n=1 Tax=Takifugu flavidus TaxID=433684 RepID=A0A5C6ML03_9TELE|nr:hypothetical protein D4764_09G0005280 [Takifugu flavidus]
MEVPRRPQPTFTLALHEQASPAPVPLGAVDADQMDAAGPPRVGSAANSHVSPVMEPPQPEDPSSSEVETKPGVGEDGSVSEEPRRKSEEEEAEGRSAQKLLLAVEELVQSERNYLRMLQVTTETIRSNLGKLQPPPPDLDSLFVHIEDVMDVSRRLLSLLDQEPLGPGDPLFLETLCSFSSDQPGGCRPSSCSYGSTSSIGNDDVFVSSYWAENVPTKDRRGHQESPPNMIHLGWTFIQNNSDQNRRRKEGQTSSMMLLVFLRNLTRHRGPAQVEPGDAETGWSTWRTGQEQLERNC